MLTCLHEWRMATICYKLLFFVLFRRDSPPGPDRFFFLVHFSGPDFVTRGNGAENSAWYRKKYCDRINNRLVGLFIVQRRPVAVVTQKLSAPAVSLATASLTASRTSHYSRFYLFSPRLFASISRKIVTKNIP